MRCRPINSSTQAVAQRSIDTAESFRRHLAMIDYSWTSSARWSMPAWRCCPASSGTLPAVAALDYLPWLSEALGQARAGRCRLV